jgi:dTDP-4-amino-4,6-dideoxygalactose transaminase
MPHLEQIWENRWLTNQGPYVRRLEQELARYLEIEGLLLITNGSIALDLAVQTLIAPGEVICPAYSFLATWNMIASDPRYTPVFVDSDQSFCIDPAAVEAVITPRTTGILAVHAYGFPCDHEKLNRIAKKAGIPLIYDAAHAFGVRHNGESLAGWGDISFYSFHATKVYGTLEGGALCGKETLLAELARRRAFGLVSEERQLYWGQNGKMDEIRAAFGLVALPLVKAAIAHRLQVASWYKALFAEARLEQLELPFNLIEQPGLEWNGAYFPVLFRNGLREKAEAGLKAAGVLARRYFVDVIGNSPLYAGRFNPAALSRARDYSSRVLCLPIHQEMTEEDCFIVVDAICRSL